MYFKVFQHGNIRKFKKKLNSIFGVKIENSIFKNSSVIVKHSRKVSQDADLACSGLCRVLSCRKMGARLQSPVGTWLDCSPEPISEVLT